MQYNKMLASALMIGTTLALGAAQHPEAEVPTRAIAIIQPASGSKVAGTVTFTKALGGVRVEAKITGLTPGKHGFHIHEFGDTSSPDAKSAGGHFNPKGSPHAGPGQKRHIGDLGNIEADDKGDATYDKIDSQLMFHGETSILGRGLVIHAKEDDLKTQPTGNAGDRVGVAVIGAAKGK